MRAVKGVKCLVDVTSMIDVRGGVKGVKGVRSVSKSIPTAVHGCKCVLAVHVR